MYFFVHIVIVGSQFLQLLVQLLGFCFNVLDLLSHFLFLCVLILDLLGLVVKILDQSILADVQILQFFVVNFHL